MVVRGVFPLLLPLSLRYIVINELCPDDTYARAIVRERRVRDCAISPRFTLSFSYSLPLPLPFPLGSASAGHIRVLVEHANNILHT